MKRLMRKQRNPQKRQTPVLAQIPVANAASPLDNEKIISEIFADVEDLDYLCTQNVFSTKSTLLQNMFSIKNE